MLPLQGVKLQNATYSHTGNTTNTAEMADAEMTDQETNDNTDKNNPPKFIQVTGADGFSFLLPTPRPEDDLETTARKLHGLTDALSNGGSLTLLPSQRRSQSFDQYVEAFAKARMTTQELTQYNKWKENKLTIPDFDWTNWTCPVAAEAIKTFTHRATAMDILWHRPGAAATPGNAVWLSNHLHTILPLVKAIEKRVTAWASLGMQNPWAQLTERELWELEALQLVRGTVEGNLAREREQMRSAQKSMAVLMQKLKSFERVV